MSIFLFDGEAALSAELVDTGSGNDGIIEGTKWALAGCPRILGAQYLFNIKHMKPKRRVSSNKTSHRIAIRDF